MLKQSVAKRYAFIYSSCKWQSLLHKEITNLIPQSVKRRRFATEWLLMMYKSQFHWLCREAAFSHNGHIYALCALLLWYCKTKLMCKFFYSKYHPSRNGSILFWQSSSSSESKPYQPAVESFMAILQTSPVLAEWKTAVFVRWWVGSYWFPECPSVSFRQNVDGPTKPPITHNERQMSVSSSPLGLL